MLPAMKPLLMLALLVFLAASVDGRARLLPSREPAGDPRLGGSLMPPLAQQTNVHGFGLALAPDHVWLEQTSGETTLQQALAELKKQTGNTVEDHRSQPTNPTLKLAKIGPFWPTLDAIGKETGIGFSAYQPGGVALIDKPYRELKVSYHDRFRFAFKRIALSRDEETQAHACRITLDVAWEPSFTATYANLEGGTVGVKGMSEKLDRQAAQNVVGANAAEFELRMKAPPRQVSAIDALTGELRVVGVPKMLEFKFAQLAAGQKQETEGVKVSLLDVKQSAKSWSFEIQCEHPKAALAAVDTLDSFQKDAWKSTVRVWLAWYDPKTKRTYEIEPSGNGPEQAAGGATKVRYYFSARDNAALPPRGVEVALHYRTPKNVEIVTVPFSFRDLPLP